MNKFAKFIYQRLSFIIFLTTFLISSPFIRFVFAVDIITTIAGTGTEGYSGDDGSATSAQLSLPQGIALDIFGNLYIADYGNSCIREINTSGIIATVAGTGTGGYSGDNGQATNAKFNSPRAVAVDNAGNIWVADTDNHRIRKINSLGVVTTVAGTGWFGYSGDGGQATSAEFFYPLGVVVDISGNLYIADYGNHRVRKIGTSGVITTIAGTGSFGYSGDGGSATSAELSNPVGITLDNLGNLYIADIFNHRIRKVDTSGIVTTVVGTGVAGYSGDGGQATSAQLYNPTGVAIDTSGNLYIADTFNHRIRKIDPSGIITTVVGTGIAGYSGDNGVATLAQLYNPTGITTDTSGNLYITDTNNHCICKISHLVNLKEVRIYPNPYKPGSGHKKIVFSHLSENSSIKIFTLVGELVWEKEDITTGTEEWLAVNKDNEKVTSGVYIYLISDKAGNKKSGKIAVIK